MAVVARIKRFVKGGFFQLFAIFVLFVISWLIALPKVPVKFSPLGLDTNIGGYYFSLFNDKIVLDFRDIKRGLDLQGGVRLVLRANMEGVNEEDKDKALESAREVISRRVDFLGVVEPKITTIKTANDYRIEVEIPGVANVDQAVRAIGQTAQLKFKVLPKDKEWNQENLFEYFTNLSLWQDSGITGADLKGAEVVFGQSANLQERNKPQIQLIFTSEGRKKFSDLVKDNVGRPIGIFLDDVPISTPIVNPDLAQGLSSDPIISGDFNLSDAKALALQIRAGALPVPIEILSQENVSATLGADSIQKSLRAGLLGLGAVMVFMLIFYGKLGLVANFGLLLYTSLVICLFKIIPVTLTLPGIAGFILTIGMAVDASILVFERIREEIKWGKPASVALKLGFERSWLSIRDSNVSSLLTAATLFYFGSGMVRGFALTLAIGVLVSMFTNIFIVRTIIRRLGWL